MVSTQKTGPVGLLGNRAAFKEVFENAVKTNGTLSKLAYCTSDEVAEKKQISALQVLPYL